jgi:hypothetical protein
VTSLLETHPSVFRATGAAVRVVASRTGCHPYGAVVVDTLRKAARGERVAGLVLRHDNVGEYVDAEPAKLSISSLRSRSL